MRDRPLCSGCLIVFLLISISMITGGTKFVEELRPSILEKYFEEKDSIRLSGYIYDIDEKDDYQIVYLKNNSIIYQNKSFKESRIIIHDEEKMNIAIGNQIEVSGVLSFYEKNRNPGNFDQKFYYLKQGIHASVWASEIRVKRDVQKKLKNRLHEVRGRWKAVLCERMGEEDGAILSAILLGEKAGMDEEVKELYQANGIAHVLAISGLHLSVIGVGLYKLFQRISGSYLMGGIAGSIFLILYILMIGVSVSVLRAMIMFLFRVGADMTGRHYDMSTALLAAASITVVWNPLYLYDGGFWLSYGAILAMILVLPVFEELIFQSFWSSVSISLMTLPVLAYYFYEIPVYSVFLNLMILPLMTLILLGGLSGSALVISPVLENVGGWMLGVCKIIFAFYKNLCEIFLKLPYARIVTGRPQLWKIIIYYGCLLFLATGWRRKRKWCLGTILMMLSVTLILFPDVGQYGGKKDVRITVLDVGQGDGIFIKGPEGKTYFIDGGSSDVKALGKYRIEPFLKSQGVGKIDYVFISHGDSDHMSGIMEMIGRMDVGIAIETIVFPERNVWNENINELARMAIENGIQVVTVSEGQQLVEGEMIFTCLAPQNEFAKKVSDKESNAASMVLALNYGGFDMLFTGDVEEEGEEILTTQLKEKYNDVKWEVLKVAHHGSKNSTTEEFLDEVCPVYSVISAGQNNSYGHPHEETLQRLRQTGSRIQLTQVSGAVTIRTDGEKMVIENYLKNPNDL